MEKHWQSPSSAPGEVKTGVSPLVTCAKNHSNRNIRTIGNSLGSLVCGVGPDESSSSDAPLPVLGSILHPPKDTVGTKATGTPKASVTPKQKTTPTSFSPLNKSPLETPTRRNKRKLDEEQFVVIKRPTPVKMVLTEHQKEVLRRKADIPALYQDLSQDTQSASQDCVILPSSPANPPKKPRIDPDEEAVMDFDDIQPFKNAGRDLDTSVSILQEEKSKVHGTIEIDDNATMQSVADSDDVLTCSQESDMAVRLEDEPASAAEEKVVPVTPNRRKSIVPVKKEPTVTRSRKLHESLVTRSGKLLKGRQSDGTFKSPPKVKRQRKSLPAEGSALYRSESESSEDTPETRSPTKALARGRGSRVALKPPAKTAEAKDSKVAEETPVTEPPEAALETSQRNSEETLSAASPSTESSHPSSDVSTTPDAASKPGFTSPPPSAIRERSRRKTTPTRKALLLFEEHGNVDRISQAVSIKSTKASKGESPKPGGRPQRRSRLKTGSDDSDPKPEGEVPKEGPAAASEPVVVIEKLSTYQSPVKAAPELVEIPASDPEASTRAEPEAVLSSAEPAVELAAEPTVEPSAQPSAELAVEPAVERPVKDAAEPAAEPETSNLLEAGEPKTQEPEGPAVPGMPCSEVVIPESQDIIESSQSPEDSLGITTPRCAESPKKVETPANAKWTLRVSDTFTPLDPGETASPAPGTPKSAAEDKPPRRIVDEKDDRSDSMPSWMHAKKVVSPGKPRLVKRILPADLVKVSQAPVVEVSESPPRAGAESTPTSSPVQSKWTRSESTPTGRSPGSLPMRTGRAAHLLGLGQAAAARSGEEIRATLSPSQKEEAPAAASAPAPAATAEAAAVPAPGAGPGSGTAAALNAPNGMSFRATLNGHVIASPRVRKRTRMGLSARFSDGQPKEPQT